MKVSEKDIFILDNDNRVHRYDIETLELQNCQEFIIKFDVYKEGIVFIDLMNRLFFYKNYTIFLSNIKTDIDIKLFKIIGDDLFVNDKRINLSDYAYH